MFKRPICALLLLSLFSINFAVAQPIAEGKDKFLGCCHSSTQAPYFEKYWNQVTPENGTKWGSVEGTRDQMNWSAAESAYNLAKKNDFPFRFHVLVWGNQQPGWIEALEPAEQLEEIREWFAAAAEKFPDMEYVEVVNEPLHDPPDAGDGGYINALGGSNDLYGTGWDWIIKAFELAREIFPSTTKLMINEYGIVGSSTSTNNYLKIIKLLQDRDLIDGIGVQAHAFNTRGAAPATMKKNLDALAETGLPIQVCEMDIDGLDDDVQLNEYKRVFPTFWHHPGIEGITLWGWRQGLWRDKYGAYLVDERGKPRLSLEWLQVAVNLPAVPSVFSPNHIVDVPLNPVLSWNRVELATSYIVQMSASNRFNTIFLDTTVTDTFLQIISPLETDKRYYWRINSLNEHGESGFSDLAYFTTVENVTAIESQSDKMLSEKIILEPNYPNPFNPSTEIRYQISENSSVRLAIFDALGKEVDVLVQESQTTGRYTVTWDASSFVSGIYFCILQSGDFVQIQKLIYVK